MWKQCNNVSASPCGQKGYCRFEKGLPFLVNSEEEELSKVCGKGLQGR